MSDWPHKHAFGFGMFCVLCGKSRDQIALERLAKKPGASAITEAEHRGARAMLLWLLGAAKISAQDAEDGRRAIESGWVRADP